MDHEEGNEDTQVQSFEDAGDQQGGQNEYGIIISTNQTAGSSESLESILQVEALDVGSSSSSTALALHEDASPRLAANGLIKMQWPPAVHIPCFDDLEHMLFDFCKRIFLYIRPWLIRF